MKFAKVKDLLAGALMLVLGLILFVSSFSIPSGASLGLGPSFMPRLMSTVLIFFGVIISVDGVKCWSRWEKDEAEEELKDNRAVLLTLIFLLVYIVLMKPLGFILSTTGYISAQILLFAHKLEETKTDKIKYIVIAAVSSIVIYYVFTKGFSLLLPSGILG